MITTEANTLFSQFIYEEPKDRPVNFYCTEFQRILDVINGVLFKYIGITFSFNSTKITKSKYDVVPKYKCKSMWRITSDDYPALTILCLNSDIKTELNNALSEVFPQYIGNVIKVNTYAYNTKASIIIMPGGLVENTFTQADLKVLEVKLNE